MTLFAQEMDEPVLAPVNFINFCGDIPQVAFCPDFVEEDRHQLGKLLEKVIDRLDGVVEKLRDVALKQVCILDACP